MMMSKFVSTVCFIYLCVAVCICLGITYLAPHTLPADIQEEQWKYVHLAWVLCVPAIGMGCFVFMRQLKDRLSLILSWSFILLGTIEAIWGLRQVYGFTHSNHLLYVLTGSFYNPGPYSGYLALIFPICLYEWLKCRKEKKTIFCYITLFVMLLLLCVLPAGMSRSAWIAVVVSSAYIGGMHFRQAIKEYVKSHRKQVWTTLGLTLLLGGIALSGIYQMKKDSADGRLFMWKIATHAVCEHPWTGTGWNSVPAAYGQAQENYFAGGNYTKTEEHVAGAPEYVFNEYLQVAIAWGIPALCIGILVIGSSMYAGHKRGEYGLCAALLALAVFAFSSYPLQFPAFVSALVMLVLACGIGALPLEKLWFRMLFVLLLGVVGYGCFKMYQQKTGRVESCLQWNRSRMLYQAGAYRAVIESYSDIYEEMKWNARFMFEYGHALHKLHRPSDSNAILKEALKVSGDAMILNIIGKNEQEMGNYESAEQWLVRSTHRLPGRIYPYYLLAKLYADSAYYQPSKLREMAEVVWKKTPKVPSTAIKEMQKELEKLVKKSNDMK